MTITIFLTMSLTAAAAVTHGVQALSQCVSTGVNMIPVLTNLDFCYVYLQIPNTFRGDIQETKTPVVIAGLNSADYFVQYREEDCSMKENSAPDV